MELAAGLIRLDPFPQPLAAGSLGLANYLLERSRWRSPPSLTPPDERRGTAPFINGSLAHNARLGELDRAREEAAAVLKFEPDYTIRSMGKHFSPFKRPGDAEHLFEGMRRAGLPEE